MPPPQPVIHPKHYYLVFARNLAPSMAPWLQGQVAGQRAITYESSAHAGLPGHLLGPAVTNETENNMEGGSSHFKSAPRQPKQLFDQIRGDLTSNNMSRL